MNPFPVERDERTEAVENASYRLAFTLMSFGILADVMYRGAVRHEAAWDLFALVILGGGVGRAYQGRAQALPQGWAAKGLIIALFAAAIGAGVALLRR